MAFTKAKIYNLALSALLLQRQTTDPDTDVSNEVVAINNIYDTALEHVVADLDLDSHTTDVTLALIETDPTDDWAYSYTFPASCVVFRRVRSTALKDNKTTRIPLRILVDAGVKVVYTNQVDAEAEVILSTIAISLWSASAALALAYRCAILAAPLVVGKGAKALREDLHAKYMIAKAEAQEQDARDNFNFTEPEVDSEWVQQRLE
jgi:hypothetical protein